MEPPKADGDLAVEEHRRHIHLVWQELGVGRNGFLTMEELASVCQKIGMEQMNDEVSVFSVHSMLSVCVCVCVCFVTKI